MSTVEDIIHAIRPRLAEDDDEALWRAVMTVVLEDANRLLGAYEGKAPVFLKIGSCSHWLRPHQTRWGAAGGFAWPAGYGDGGGWSRWGLPRLDWSEEFQWAGHGVWERSTRRRGRRPLVLRVVVPSRSGRHGQAAVHTMWVPGSPSVPREKRVRYLGFRRRDTDWLLEADDTPLWEPSGAGSA